MPPECIDLGYGSHIAPLAWAVASTTGPVLELGCGWWSTPLLRALCLAQNRALMTWDDNAEWISQVKEQFPQIPVDPKTLLNISGMHSYIHLPWTEVHNSSTDAPGWNNPRELLTMLGIGDFSVVFVDHSPGERRVEDIIAFKDSAEIIVVHDSQNPDYKYERGFEQFKYRHTWSQVLQPHTTLLSNIVDVSKCP